MKGEQPPALREATGAFCQVLLDHILPPMRLVARERGYAITVHGSLKRDIDLVAVPWREHNVDQPDELVKHLCGAVASVLGRCMRHSDASQKPHGRVAYTLVHGGFLAEIDLSVFPPIEKTESK